MKLRTKKNLLISGIVIAVMVIALGIASARSNQTTFSLTSPASFPVDI